MQPMSNKRTFQRSGIISLLFKRSPKSSQGSPTHPGNIDESQYVLFQILVTGQSIQSQIYIDTFVHKLITPTVPNIKVSSPKFTPNNHYGKIQQSGARFLRLVVKGTSWGTKIIFKTIHQNQDPPVFSNSSLHSLLVISLTVVKQSTWCAFVFWSV